MARIFGVLNNGEVEFRKPNAPVTAEGRVVITNDPEIMLKAGYKLVILSEMSEDKNSVCTWVEDEKTITQIWTVSEE